MPTESLPTTNAPAKVIARVEDLEIREQVRQAILIAARDEMGLSTRDAALREFDPAAPGARDRRGTPTRVFTALNGRSWPHTERLGYAVGDSVRWRLVNASATPPFQIDDDNLAEETRLAYRVLDLRRELWSDVPVLFMSEDRSAALALPAAPDVTGI